MKPIHVHMTDEDVEFGEQQNDMRCAGVLGIKAADPEIERVRVRRDYVTFSHRGDDLRRKVPTPRALARFIDQFDPEGGKAKVKPISFTIDPEQAVKTWPVEHEGGPARLKRQAARPRTKGTGKPVSHRPPVTAEDGN
jgi:hypothetical protein